MNMSRPGKYNITLGAEDWLKGHASSRNLSDGTFYYNDVKESMSDDNIGAVNVWSDPGVLYPAPEATEWYIPPSETSATPVFVATCKGDFNLGAVNFFVKSDGSVYSDLGGSLTTILTDSTANRNYIETLTQMVIVNYVLYISSGGGAAQVIKIPLNSYDGSYSSGADLSWLTTTKGVSYSHAPSQPLYVWENNLWIGNENKIHRYTPSSDTMSSSVLVLNNDNVITSIGSDSVANNLFVATSIGYNGNKSRSINNKIFIWDGINVKPSRAIFVEGTVSAFYNVAGLTYILYGESGLGYWNGSGITLLRQLRILKGTNQPILNQYTITNWKNNLVVVDGNRILMYASIKNRPKAWYCVYVSSANNTDGFNYFNFVTTYDEDNLLISYNYSRSNTIRTRLLKLPMNVEEITNFYTDRGFTGKISLAPIDFKDNLVKVRAVKIIMNKLIQLTPISIEMYALSNNIKQTYTYDYKEYQSYRSDDGIGNPVGTDTIIWRPDRDTDTAFDNFQL